jgi:hypothetical protein
MSLNRQDFEVTAYTAKTVYFDLTDSAGLPLDLTGVPLRWRVAAAIDATNADLEKGNTNPLTGLTVPNPSTGQCVVAILDTDIEDSGLYWHFLEGNIAATGWQCLARGRMVVNPSMGAAA